MRVFAAIALLCAMTTAALAQTIRGTVTGTVSDSTGAVLPGVTITLTNVATGVSATAVSNQQGGYTVPLVPPGTYEVAAELSGFKKYLRTGLVVEISQTTRLDVSLQVGTVSE